MERQQLKDQVKQLEKEMKEQSIRMCQLEKENEVIIHQLGEEQKTHQKEMRLLEKPLVKHDYIGFF